MQVHAALAVLMTVSACDRVFNLQPVAQETDALAPDDSSRPGFCASAAIYDSFDGSVPCAFGAQNGAMGLEHRAGLLAVTLDGSAPAFGGCSTFNPLPFTSNGVFTHVAALLTTDSSYTTLRVRNALQVVPELSASVGFDGRQLRFVVNDQTVASRDDLPAWWRLHRVSATELAAAVSTDGSTWQTWATTTVAIPATIAVDLGAGVTAVTGMTGVATFSVFGVCD